MRAIGVLLLLLVAACSENRAERKDVDVSAAASRAEADIANYAVARSKARSARRTERPRSKSTPLAYGAGGGPMMAK